MFESYIQPLIMKYADRYIKNITQDDLKLSIWGGDLVLRNVELKLDAISKALPLCPLNLKSGIIRELRVHIPWTTIRSQPVEITMDTIEFVVGPPVTDPHPEGEGHESEKGEADSKSSSQEMHRKDTGDGDGDSDLEDYDDQEGT